MSKVFISTKTYEHSVGLSCCFRQHKAMSHCNKLHGYALQVRIEFIAGVLDENGWVVDFGGLKEIKEWLMDTFDHKTLVARDDPEFTQFEHLRRRGLIDMQAVKRTGCEGFAEMIFDHVNEWTHKHYQERVTLRLVEVREHGGNSGACLNSSGSTHYGD